jgi:hypothetical protein
MIESYQVHNIKNSFSLILNLIKVLLEQLQFYCRIRKLSIANVDYTGTERKRSFVVVVVTFRNLKLEQDGNSKKNYIWHRKNTIT